jgi:tight adherence protein B
MTALVAGLALALSVLLVRRPGSSRGRLARMQPAMRTPRESRVVGWWLRSWHRRREVTRREAEVVEVVFALAAELRAGRPPGRALALVAASSTSLRPLLADAAAAVEAGARPGEELAILAHVPGCSGLSPVAGAWTVTESAGGAVADVLDRLGEVLEAERQARDALDAALAGPRATMLLLAGLPVLGLVLGESLGAHPVGLLVHRPLGWALLAAGAMLDGVGVLRTRLLVRRALR